MSSSILSQVTLELIAQIISTSSIETAVKEVGKIVNSKEKTEKEDLIKVDYKLLNEQIILAQNLAIANRIETADEVEIEEYYDTEREGTLGLKGSNEGISFGLNASGKVIEKRIYKFKGYNDKRIETYEQTRDKIFNLEKKIDIDETEKEP